jgi:hypothetical protein
MGRLRHWFGSYRELLLLIYILDLLRVAQPFTDGFPRADIHDVLTPDLLHQVIKGCFKDHLVTWVVDYIEGAFPSHEANETIAEIDRRWVKHLSSICIYVHTDS